jgi:hypothetical protein
MDWCNTLMFADEWLFGTEILVKVCHGKESQKATEQALPIPGVVILSQIFIKIHVHNRGHVLAATQVVMFNGYLGILTSTIKTHTNTFFTKVLWTWKDNL